MLTLNELSKLRFKMTELPNIGGEPGTYEERLSQWFLERSFFRDFTYRNPRGRKKGQELADAVILFGDVAVLVQVKAQCGAHIPTAWATEALLKAYKQICNTHTALNDGSIKRFKNDLYGDLPFDSRRVPNQIGVIVLAQKPTTPYVAAELVPELLQAPFPIHVFALEDFGKVAARFDTAGDLITFLELRSDTAGNKRLLVHDEEGNIQSMLPHVCEVLRSHNKTMSEEMLRKTYDAFEKKATGVLLQSPEWKYGLVIDDMIAHSHDVDPDLPWNKGRSEPRRALDVAQYLGWLTRDRRIRLGKRVISLCEKAIDGRGHYFHYRKPSRAAGYIFLVTSDSRSNRVAYLHFLVSYAYVKYGLRECLGVATEPIGAGRSYDFIVVKRQPPPYIIKKLKEFDDPFADGESL